MKEHRKIDLRSDTVTQPTRAMREAAAAAPVGDDVYGEDPSMNQLESAVAEILGKERGLFMPSGIMANQVAIHLHTQPGDEVIADRLSHIYQFEMGAMAALSGTLPHVLDSENGLPDPDRVLEAIRPPLSYRSRTGLIALENTHNIRGGRILPRGGVSEVLRIAKEHEIPTHLDGARIWNASVASGVPEAELADGFDSVMACLSKGLCAPVGSVLCGTTGFIERARRVRRMFGGGMRQAGILAAAGLEALKMRTRLSEDHARAKILAEHLALCPGVAIDPSRVETNIIVFNMNGSREAEKFQHQLGAKGILVSRVGGLLRLVTHHGITSRNVQFVLDTIEEILR